MDPIYEVICWPGHQTHGEHIHLLLELVGVPYSSRLPGKGQSLDDFAEPLLNASPPIYRFPVLRHGDMLINGISNILTYLAEKHILSHLEPRSEEDIYRINSILDMALSMPEDIDGCHYNNCMDLPEEDQEAGRIKHGRKWLTHRLHGCLRYLEAVLHSHISGSGPWMYKGTLTHVDLVVFQCLDEVMYQFPMTMKATRESAVYDRVFKLYEAVKMHPRIHGYLVSDRRLRNCEGVYVCDEKADVNLTFEVSKNVNEEQRGARGEVAGIEGDCQGEEDDDGGWCYVGGV